MRVQVHLEVAQGPNAVLGLGTKVTDPALAKRKRWESLRPAGYIDRRNVARRRWVTLTNTNRITDCP